VGSTSEANHEPSSQTDDNHRRTRNLSCLALLLSHLALTDIRHAEADLSLEWGVLRISALVFGAFTLSTSVALRALSRA
jgi:hypothetical protein